LIFINKILISFTSITDRFNNLKEFILLLDYLWIWIK
jgi:hypothetical protein